MGKYWDQYPTNHWRIDTLHSSYLTTNKVPQRSLAQPSLHGHDTHNKYNKYGQKTVSLAYLVYDYISVKHTVNAPTSQPGW